MKRFVGSFRSSRCLAALAALVVVGAGCATNGRYVLLKEYAATGPSAPTKPLEGLVICLKPFQCATNLTSPDPTTKPEQPEQFQFIEYTEEQNKTWDREFRAAEKDAPKADLREIGNLRNMFGMVMSKVYAVNDPGKWLVESLKMDLENQGAKVVDVSRADSADLCLSGTLRFCRVDIYMKIWGDLVVDLDLQTKDGTCSNKVLHTGGGTMAWVGSTAEFYKPLRECRQKLSWLATREIKIALKR